MKERLSLVLVLVLNTPCLILILWLGAAFLQCDWYCIYVCLHICIACRHTKHMSIMTFYMVTSDMGSILSEGSRSSCEMALASPYLGFHRSASCLMRRLCGGGWLIFINSTRCDSLLWKLVSKEGVSEEHLADHVDEVDAVRQQHLRQDNAKPGVHADHAEQASHTDCTEDNAGGKNQPEDSIHHGCPSSRHNSRTGHTLLIFSPHGSAQTGWGSPWSSVPGGDYNVDADLVKHV